MEYFRFDLGTSDNVFAAAIENAYNRKYINSITAAHDCGFVTNTISNDHYLQVCQALQNGRAVIGTGFHHHLIRDCCGFCSINGLSDTQQYFIGYTNNSDRPGIVCCTNTDYPRGNDRPILPGKTKISLPRGAYLIDASTFDRILLDQTMLVI